MILKPTLMLQVSLPVVVEADFLKESFMEAAEKDFYSQLHDFIDWMEKDGMLDRWERQKKNDEVQRNRRRLNKKIREKSIVLECLT